MQWNLRPSAFKTHGSIIEKQLLKKVTLWSIANLGCWLSRQSRRVARNIQRRLWMSQTRPLKCWAHRPNAPASASASGPADPNDPSPLVPGCYLWPFWAPAFLCCSWDPPSPSTPWLGANSKAMQGVSRPSHSPSEPLWAMMATDLQPRMAPMVSNCLHSTMQHSQYLPCPPIAMLLHEAKSRSETTHVQGSTWNSPFSSETYGIQTWPWWQKIELTFSF